MPRYFIELSYKGEGYSGFQRQDNANTIQAEVEKALKTYFRETFELTGSSRTDAGVHALGNYFHFDSDIEPEKLAAAVYHLNAILPSSIVIKRIFPVKVDAHCRFDALFRTYEYHIYRHKDPFLEDRAHFYPFKINRELLDVLAAEVLKHEDFMAFSKRSTQVHTYNCTISESYWKEEDGILIYTVTSNRFLRGMVRGLVGTMLKASKGLPDVTAFRAIIENKDPARVDFSVPGKGLFLVEVRFPY